MKSINFVIMSCVLLVALVPIAIFAEERSLTGITPGDNRGMYNIGLTNELLTTFVREVSFREKVNIVIPKELMEKRVTCGFDNVRLIDAFRCVVASPEWILDEKVYPKSRIFIIRTRTTEEVQAESLKRFYDALRNEGFTDEQAMKILLQDMVSAKKK